MCYSKPGPRCSPHAKEQLVAAEAAFALSPNGSERRALTAARIAYDLTPDGIEHHYELSRVAAKNDNVREAVQEARIGDDLAAERKRLIALSAGQVDHNSQHNEDVTVLNELISSKSAIDRETAARDSNLTPELAELLSRDVSSKVREAVACHPVTPATVIARLALDYMATVRANAFKHENMTTEGLSAAASSVIGNEKERLADHRFSATPPDVEAFISSPIAPSECLREFASLDHPYLKVPCAIAANPNTPIDTLLHFAKSEDPEIRESALANSNLNTANVAEYLAPGDTDLKEVPLSWLIDMALLKKQ